MTRFFIFHRLTGHYVDVCYTRYGTAQQALELWSQEHGYNAAKFRVSFEWCLTSADKLAPCVWYRR